MTFFVWQFVEGHLWKAQWKKKPHFTHKACVMRLVVYEELLSFLVKQNLDGMLLMVFFFFEKDVVEGHLWKAQWKEKPNDEGHRKLTMNS